MDLPLRVEPDQPSHGCSLCLVGGNGAVIARTPLVDGFGCAEQQQDLEALVFIKNACNLHAELVAALREALKVVSGDNTRKASDVLREDFERLLHKVELQP